MLWQSAEQCRREVEAADAASVARLVRGVCYCHAARNAPLLCLYRSYVCWWWCWRGQTGAGLGALRSPAVGKVSPVMCVCVCVCVCVL